MNITASTASTLRLAAFAGAALLGLAPVAHATIISVNPATPIIVPQTIDGVTINLVTGEISETYTSAWETGWDISLWSYPMDGEGDLLMTDGPNTTRYVGLGSFVDALPVGFTIDASTKYSLGCVSQSCTNYASGWWDGATGYLGFRFLNEATGAINYGYALVQTGAQNGWGFPAAILSYTYDNSGAGITISAVPEPASYATMALGLAGLGGLARLRRRRSA